MSESDRVCKFLHRVWIVTGDALLKSKRIVRERRVWVQHDSLARLLKRFIHSPHHAEIESVLPTRLTTVGIQRYRGSQLPSRTIPVPVDMQANAAESDSRCGIVRVKLQRAICNGEG